ncbi:MAG: LAGLIDADG family homing endonuclease [Candidatus Heimdallarchaeaceae archaeon]
MKYLKYTIQDYNNAIFLRTKGFSIPKIAKKLNINDSTIWAWVNRGSRPHCISDKNREKNVLKDDKKKLTKEVAFVLGAIYGDGNFARDNQIKLVSIDREYVEAFKKAIEKWTGMNASKIVCYEREFKPQFNCWFSSRSVCEFLSGIDLNDLISSNEDIKCAFLRSFFDSEGHVAKKYRQICVINTNLKLIKLTKKLLSSLGIRTTPILIQKGNGFNKKAVLFRLHLKMSPTNVRLFKEKVNFTIERKRQRLGEYYAS